jgi:hypothetical protein
MTSSQILRTALARTLGVRSVMDSTARLRTMQPRPTPQRRPLTACPFFDKRSGPVADDSHR